MVVTAALALAPLLQAAPTSALRWAPRRGTRLVYALTVRDAQGRVVSEGALELNVTETGRDGYTVVSRNRGMVVRSGAEEIRDESDRRVTLKHAPDGRVISLTGDTDVTTGLRQSAFFRFVAPPNRVSKGQSWIIDRPARDRVNASTSRFTWEGIDERTKRPRAVISSETRETGRDAMTGQGTWLIDMETGVVEEMVISVQGWKVNGTDRGTFAMKRV